MRIMNNNMKHIIIVLIFVFCLFFVSISSSFAIYRTNLNTTINLTVVDPSNNYVINFDENYNNGNSWNVVKTYGEQLGSDYTIPTRTGYSFLGWFTSDTGGTKIGQDTTVAANDTYYAHWEKIVCMKAQENTLHTETCRSGGGCLRHGYSVNSQITYGNIPSQGDPEAGDAYDCDVNNDGTFSPTTERFYFVREISGNTEKAALVHYTSFDEDGQMDSSDSRENYTYDDGKAYLPSSSIWSNPSLSSFDTKVSRYITLDDVLAACGGQSIIFDNAAYLSTCQYFMENSRYQSSSLGRSGIWVDQANNTQYRFQSSSAVIQVPENNPSRNTVRPMIEVPLASLEGYHCDAGYTITLMMHGGEGPASVTRYPGETLGTIAATRAHYDLDGWYASYNNDIYSDPVSSSTVITGNMTLHAKWTPRATNTVTFDANGGTINGESTYDLIVDTGETVPEEDFPVAVYADKDLEGWYINGNSLTPFTSATVVNADITVVASWDLAHYVARIGNTKYQTLADAVDAVPDTLTKTTITILDNIELSEAIVVDSTKWIELDIGNYTISDSANYDMSGTYTQSSLFLNNGKIDVISGSITSTNPFIFGNASGSTLNISGGTFTFNNTQSTDPKVIENVTATVNITGGTLICNAKAATINNKGSGTINMSGGIIRASNTYKGQAIYMEGVNPRVNISGTAYIENVSGGGEARAAIDNNSNGTLTITGGTIVSKGYTAVKNRTTNAKTVIGNSELPIYTDNPVIRGKEYGLEITAGTVSVYDGIFESELQSLAISTTNVEKPTQFETSGIIIIDNVTYHTAYLKQPSYTVTFYPENGDNSEEVDVPSGTAIGNLMPQTPSKTGYFFGGWFASGTQITNETVVNEAIEAHAKWLMNVANATFTAASNPLSVEINDTKQIAFTQEDIEPLTYTSSNDTIAEVDANGEVTGMRIGSTTITITGQRSGSTRTITVNVTPVMHDVTFNHDNGEPSTIIEVEDGTSMNSLPTPSKTNYIFNGWFIAGDSTRPFTTSTVVTGDLTVVASWSPNIQLATIPVSFSVMNGYSKTLEISGPEGMESYTFTSNDNSVATVTQQGNVATVTGVSLGSTTITVTGSRSNTTRTIPVEVTTVIYHTVTFLDDDNTLVSSETVVDGQTLSTLPSATARTDYIFDNWYIQGDSTRPFTTSTTVTGDLTVIASWKEKLSIATVTTNPSPFKIKVGTTGQITVTPTGGGRVENCTFTSSDSNVAEIDTSTTTSTTGVVFGSSVDTVTITITGVESGQTRTVTLEVTNLNNITFDPDNGDPASVVAVADGSSVGTNVPNDPTKTDYAFDRWYLYDEVNETLTTTPFDPSETIASDKTYKAKWVDDSNYVAIDWTNGTEYYDSIKTALTYVPTNTLTEIRIIQDIDDTNGQTSVPASKQIVINGGNHTMSCGPSTTNQLMISSGTLKIKSGTFTCDNATLAVFQVATGGKIYIEGGTIHNYNNRGAIYNEGGYIEISGGTLSSDALIRPVVQNAKSGASILMTGGQIIQTATGNVNNGSSNSKDDGRGAIKVINNTSATITGGTVISNATNSAGIYATGGTLIIGTDDDEATVSVTYDVTSPIIQGENYGVMSNVSYSIFDGTIKGKNSNGAVNDVSKINETTGIETNHERQTGIDNGYKTLYYVPVLSKYRINFNANGGTVSDDYLEFNLNTTITTSSLPVPTRQNYTFDGWYTNEELTTPFTTITPDTAAIVTYYAKWTFNSSLTPVTHNVLSDAMVDYFTNVSSWVAADANDPSNLPAREASASNGYDNGHHLFKSSIDDVFEDNNCSYCGADNKCDNPEQGTYCDQPIGYDTGLNGALNVYLFENNTKGSLVTYTTSTNGVIYNMIPGTTYYWELASDTTKYGVISATGSRRTLKTSVRNLRDLGGLSASNDTVSGTIDYGRLYRGAQITSSQGVTDLTKLGITREIDLRGDGDGNQTYKFTNYDTGTSNNYTDIVVTNYIINPTVTSYIATAHIDNYRNVKSTLRAIMEKVVFDHDSIYLHCTIGTDRTGTIAYFLEGLLGVSEEDRLRDYELTYFYGLTNRTRFHDAVSWSNISPRFYSMYRSYPTNTDIYNYFTYEQHVVDPNNQNDLTDAELLRRFRLELIH